MTLYDVYSCSKCGFMNTWKKDFQKDIFNPCRKICPECGGRDIDLIQGPSADYARYDMEELLTEENYE